MTRVFDLIAVGKISIIASQIEMFAEKAERSCDGPVVSKD